MVLVATVSYKPFHFFYASNINDVTNTYCFASVTVKGGQHLYFFQSANR